MNAQEFGKWLREKRKIAGIGLRRFAWLIDDLPSNVCDIENGTRSPWKDEAKLRLVADALGFVEEGPDLYALLRLARSSEYLEALSLVRSVLESRLDCNGTRYGRAMDALAELERIDPYAEGYIMFQNTMKGE